MNVAQLRTMLQDAINDGYGDYYVNFCDQDGDTVTINKCYEDDDDDVCLESNEFDTYEYTAEQLLSELEDYNNNTYIYVYDDDNDLNFDIDDDKDWYIGEDDCLTIDTYYEEDDD